MSLLLEICNKYPSPVSEAEAGLIYDQLPEQYTSWVSKSTFVKFLSQKSRPTFLWHDYEAGGTDASTVAALQCAMIRTDKDLNIIDSPIDIYCKLHGDKIPHPEAIRITGIDPMKCYNEGMPEPRFFRTINEQMSFPETCNSGYNSLSYDDEVSRFGFWRNLIPVYDREWSNGCSRWDLYPVTAAFKAIDPDCAQWPTKEDGKESLKLELLAKANGITQENAHNAIDDVKALIDWARHLKKRNEALWNEFFQARLKKNNQPLFKPGQIGWWVHSKIEGESQHRAPIIILKNVPGDNNAWVYARLDKLDSLRACYRLTPDQIRERMFSKNETLKEMDVERPPIGTIKINKQPQFFAVDSIVIPSDWSIPQNLIAAGKNLMEAKEFVLRLSFAVANDDFDNNMPSEVALYAAGFPSNKDKNALSLWQLNPGDESISFESPHYQNLSKRIIWQEKDGDDWVSYCQRALTAPIKPSKHENVNWTNIHEALEKSTLDGELRAQFELFLSQLKSRFNLP